LAGVKKTENTQITSNRP